MSYDKKSLAAKNRARLWDSLEIAHIRNNCIILLIMLPIFLLICFPKTSGLSIHDHWIVIGIIVAITFLPFFAFYGIRIIRIFRKADQYYFCKAKLSQPHHSYFAKAYYFTVLIEDPEGRKFPADTHAIFATRGIIGPVMEDYLNSTVTIAYNEETDMVVVIG